METLPPHIAYAEKLNGGVLITFDDGISAVYSAVLLYEIRSRARDVTNLEPDDE